MAGERQNLINSLTAYVEHLNNRISIVTQEMDGENAVLPEEMYNEMLAFLTSELESASEFLAILTSRGV